MRSALVLIRPGLLGPCSSAVASLSTAAQQLQGCAPSSIWLLSLLPESMAESSPWLQGCL